MYDTCLYANAQNVGNEWSDALVDLRSTNFDLDTVFEEYGWQGRIKILHQDTKSARFQGQGCQGGACAK